MGRYSFVCSCVVYNSKIVNDQCIVIMLLSNETSSDVRKRIHDFVYENLELKHRIQLEDAIRDMTDYTQSLRIPGAQQEEVVEELTEEASVDNNNSGNDVSQNENPENSTNTEEEKVTEPNTESADAANPTEEKSE